MRKSVLFTSIFVCLALLGIAGFGYPGAPGRTAGRLALNVECINTHEPGGVAAIGDSITIGTSVSGWPVLAADSWMGPALCGTDIPFTFNAGIHTQTTQQIAARLDEVLAKDPAVIVILAGTNDVFKNNFGPAASERLRDMVEEAKDQGVTPILGTLPPFEGKAQKVERFNEKIRAVADAEDIPLIDFHSVLAAEDGSYKPGLTKDGIHPSEKGAQLMGELARPIIAEAMDHAL